MIKIKSATTLKTDKQRLQPPEKQKTGRITPISKPECLQTSKAQAMKEEKVKGNR